MSADIADFYQKLSRSHQHEHCRHSNRTTQLIVIQQLADRARERYQSFRSRHQESNSIKTRMCIFQQHTTRRNTKNKRTPNTQNFNVTLKSVEHVEDALSTLTSKAALAGADNDDNRRHARSSDLHNTQLSRTSPPSPPRTSSSDSSNVRADGPHSSACKSAHIDTQDTRDDH